MARGKASGDLAPMVAESKVAASTSTCWVPGTVGVVMASLAVMWLPFMSLMGPPSLTALRGMDMAWRVGAARVWLKVRVLLRLPPV